MAHIVINELQAEAKLERALRRFSADDDLLPEDSYSAALPVEVPSPLDSAQSRRSAVGAL